MSRWGLADWSTDERRRRFNQMQEEPTPERDEDNNDELSYADGATRQERVISRPGLQGTFRPNSRKRPRTSTRPVALHSSLPSPAQSTESNCEPDIGTRIKSEAESQAVSELERKPLDQRVKIYVGEKNSACEVGLKDLDKAPVLKLLISNTGSDSLFIMHPELTKISAEYFRSVREFLLTDEYMPAIINNPRGEDVLPKRLNGCALVEDYQNQALRNAHLYVIAKRLGMRVMQDLVFRKIVEAQFKLYGIECLLNLAMTVFSRPNDSQLNGKGRLGAMGEEGKGSLDGDKLEEWLVQMLGDRLQSVMINHARLFFEVANHGACAARHFGVKVLRRKVEFWNTVRKDTITIDDDDGDNAS